MGRYRVNVSVRAAEHMKAHRKSGDKGTNKRIDRILLELEEHPETGVGNPERLKHDYSGYWSRRLSSEHRLIYRIEAEVVEVIIVSAMGHYE
ncbi:Txe/YoeB family addiction module toxin [uncultured Alistipes sp.]|uniref:Txe/YoeB family addiction module toxin n=1 Tax=uncultured Alistipes sp. TaxID=538949 RepID=UPI0026285E1A|nr:Txe/YoeB family addiction module toxin [uncultured Alistipes sp.]